MASLDDMGSRILSVGAVRFFNFVPLLSQLEILILLLPATTDVPSGVDFTTLWFAKFRGS